MKNLVLGDSLEALIDHRGKTPKKLGADFTTLGVPVASAILVSGGVLDLQEARFVSDETFRKWMPAPVCKGDVLLTSEAPLGRVALVPSDAPLVLGQRLYGLRGKPGILDTQYLFYVLQTDKVQADLLGRSTGTTVFGIRQSALRNVQIPAPEFQQQRTIAEVLGALDDKIAANSASVRLLLDHLSAEFEFSLATDAQSLNLADVAAFHNRERVPLSAKERNLRSGPVPYYGASGVFGNVDEALFDDKLVLVGEDGSVISDRGTPVIQYIWGPAWVNNHAHVLTGISISTEILYFAVARKNVASLVTGAVQPKLSMGNLKSLGLELPPKNRLPRLEKLASTEMAMLRALRDENVRLEATRDTLLPQLMSGKIRVKDAEKTVEEVL